MAVCYPLAKPDCGAIAPARTLVELLQQRAKELPNATAYLFLEDGETETQQLTYQDLDKRARKLAAHLQSLNVFGERALLLYPSGLDFVSAFFGCLYAGVVAVPAYPPRRNQNLLRLNAIIKDSQAKAVLTTSSVLESIQKQSEISSEAKSEENQLFSNLNWTTTDKNLSTSPSDWEKPAVSAEDTAFLQYTSGSTGTPKGVMVSHRNLLNNEEKIKQAFQHSQNTIVVGWLPLFHDMGLIGNLLQPLYLGAPSILMPPTAFLQKPIRWLRAISRYGATTSGGPNFAYDWCVKRVRPEQLAGLEFSQWKVAFNGAEPIRAETCDAFSKLLAPYGFSSRAFYPCYGMAETTLLVSGGEVERVPTVLSVDAAVLEGSHRAIATTEKSNIKKIVGCGSSRLEQISIVNPDTQRRCIENEVGEIWVAGQSVTQGYWQKTELTQQTFQACLADTDAGPFLRTGDLGFLYKGELFVTGRLKDVLIIRGRNHYPQDIERTIQASHAAVAGCSGAAFTVQVQSLTKRDETKVGLIETDATEVDTTAEEKLVVVQEVSRSHLRHLNTEAVMGDIREAIAAQHQLTAHDIVLLRPHSIPKTSSGKIQRYLCRQKFMSGDLNTVELLRQATTKAPK